MAAPHLKLLVNYSNIQSTYENFERQLFKFNTLDKSASVYDSQETYELIKLCEILLAYYDSNNRVMNLILKYKSHEKFAAMLEHLAAVRGQINFNDARAVLEYNDTSMSCYAEANLNERRIGNICSLSYVFNIIIIVSFEFSKYFTALNPNNTTYLKSIFDFTNDSAFIRNFNQFNKNFSSFTILLSVISKNADECMNVWQNLNAVEALLNLIKLSPNTKLSIYGTIANVVTDQEIEKIPEIEQIIDMFVVKTCDCIQSPDGKRELQFKDEQTVQNFQVNFIYDENGKFCSITFLLSTLYKFSVNDKIKLNIYKKSGLEEALKKLILTGIEVEKQHAIQLLAQLAFNPQANAQLNADTELVSYVNQLEKKEYFEYKKLKKSCQDFNWILKNENYNSIQTEAKQEHIMISYNTGSRDMCLKIKKQLEQLGFKIWIDVNEIHGSSLDSMANAVENASCVLMCVTEKYRQSLNCQAEAQYAFRLNKVIIPLIMQQGYHSVSGWLGFIIGDKIFIDFTKYAFDESFNRLLKQIQLNNKTCTSNPLPEMKNIKIEIKESTNRGDSAQNWSPDDVSDWFHSHELHLLHDSLKPIDGSTLHQLYELKVYTPEFFFKALTKNDGIDVKSIAVFSNQLIKLFKN